MRLSRRSARTTPKPVIVPAGHGYEEAEPPTLAPPPASPWADGMGRAGARAAQVLIVLLLAAVVAFALVQLRLIVVPILIATLLAAAANPLVGAITGRGAPRLLAVWATLAAGAALLGGVGWVVVTGIRGEWDELRARALEGFDEFQAFLATGPVPIDTAQVEAGRAALLEFAQGEQFATGALAGASAAFEVVAGLFLGFVLLFFLLKDGARIWAFFLIPATGHRLRRLELVGQRSVEVLGGYVRGTAIVALVDAVVIGVALAILGVPLAFPLALLVFLGAFIPLLGATLAGIVAALVALVANGPVVALIVVAVVIAVNQLEGDVLAPVVLGKALALHPLVILLALTAGTILAGIIGALLSVPLAAVAWSAVSTWSKDKADTAQRTGQLLPPPGQLQGTDPA